MAQEPLILKGNVAILEVGSVSINIKLDMSVVWDYYHERDFLIPYLVEAFHQMNFSITAEGIETLDMAEVMSSIGCDFLQGYYFSKPLPEEEFVSYCRKEKTVNTKAE
ncbi:MAG: EAL domain-containing protein [Clostridia bacterium]|nr:EAL domain-containing protein [Clostridia bacterium]